MSPKRDRSVREIVENYRRDLPELERALLRRLIRSEYREIFQPLGKGHFESSKLKTLDRELKRSFKLDPSTHPKIRKIKKVSDFDTYEETVICEPLKDEPPEEKGFGPKSD